MSTVVIGGGIAGVSCAYHLAKAGVKDVLLLEKGELTSGSTHHAAGLVTQFNPSPTMMRFRRYSVALYNELGVFETVGSLRIAASPQSYLELRRGVSRAHGIGLDAELVGAEEVARLMPEASQEALYGAVWMPGDGYVDPHIATYAVASAARELGAEIRTHTLVTGIETRDGAVTAVETESGRIEAETVVNAAGMWAPRIAAMVGTFACSIPVDHQHIALHAVEGHELPRSTPCFRDTDNLIYGKAESGGVMFGGYEPNPVSRWHDGVPWEHGSRMLQADPARFKQLMDGAARRFPFLDDAGVTALVCHPDAMTPDGNPLLGPMPGVRGFWLAAGLSLNGFGGAGGLGKALAELVTEGHAEVDVQPYRPWRFGGPYRDSEFAAAGAREVYKYYYRLRYPYDVSEAGRPKRLSPLHERLEEFGAVFGTKNGWERADYFWPGRAVAARRRGPARIRLGEAAVARSRGRRARGDPRTPWDHRHDVVRQARDRATSTCWNVCVAARSTGHRLGRLYAAARRAWADRRRRDGDAASGGPLPRRHRRRGGRQRPRLPRAPRRAVDDVTDDLAVIGIWGRGHAKRSVTRQSRTRRFRSGTARKISVRGCRYLRSGSRTSASSATSCTSTRESAGAVWDALVETAAPEPVGYQALDSLRIEKGYRYFGTDLTASDTPFDSGVGFAVATGKHPELDRNPPARLRTLIVGGEEYLTLYGGEAVHSHGAVIGRVRSAAYGFTVRRNIALAKLPSDLSEGADVLVDVLGELVPAVVAADVLYDPANERVRA